MVFLDWKQLPWYWHGFQSFGFAAAMSLLAPGALALVFGWFAFRSRIRGVYFSIVTQALTYAATLLFFQNATGFGGNNGLTDFKRILGWPLHDPSTRAALYVASAIALVATYILCRYVVTSRLGRVLTAVRDAELKTRFCGYESTHYKLFVWTLSGDAVRAGRRALRAAGRDHQPERDAARRTRSRWRSGWRSAAADRSSGAVLGAWVVAGGKNWLTNTIPSAWLYVLGALFVVVTLFLPRGLVGLVPKLRLALAAILRRRAAPAIVSARAESIAAPARRARTKTTARRRSVHVPVPDGDAHRPLVLWVEELSVSFDGFKALERRVAGAGAGRAALPDRARTAPARRR